MARSSSWCAIARILRAPPVGAMITGKVPASRPQHRAAGSRHAALVYEQRFELSISARNPRCPDPVL
jgi:hypothetical protein